MTGTIVQIDGKLAIQTQWEVSDSTPEQYRDSWPTGLSARDWEQLEGQAAQFIGNGQLRCQNGYIVELENGANTTACHRETRPIHKPKWAVAWRDGKWARY